MEWKLGSLGVYPGRRWNPEKFPGPFHHNPYLAVVQYAPKPYKPLRYNLFPLSIKSPLIITNKSRALKFLMGILERGCSTFKRSQTIMN